MSIWSNFLSAVTDESRSKSSCDSALIVTNATQDIQLEYYHNVREIKKNSSYLEDSPPKNIDCLKLINSVESCLTLNMKRKWLLSPCQRNKLPEHWFKMKFPTTLLDQFSNDSLTPLTWVSKRMLSPCYFILLNVNTFPSYERGVFFSCINLFSHLYWNKKSLKQMNLLSTVYQPYFRQGM